jgi:glutamyl-tRNA synthetase
MAQNSLFFFKAPRGYDEKAAKKNLSTENVPALAAVLSRLSALDVWAASAVHDALSAAAAELGVGLGKVAQPLRVAVSGTSVSPPIDATLEVLGRDATLARLEQALMYARAR